ncbi:inactive hydroxysteroid dehydrogenase-like protein 1 [Pectinophora gossypiella]|uniref:inactive hydroxysteroid dehydrogenase-like protein 1 n=1 Tax=Pectinophora gossypiella TaxID=13191 RepID=UPI00214E2EBF|nr:inactive hydroxysteroid dehydrogenase-like protein 1 [Pectinophora gossypiella]
MFILIILALVGVLALCVILIDSLWSFLELVSSYLMPYFLPAEEQSLAKRFGPWAAVTGSTDGIGKQYAAELARRGLNIVLISRNPDKLRAVAQEIEKEHKVKTRVVVADFSQGPAVYPHIEEQLRDLPLGILVNNVGVQYEYPMPLCEVPTAKAWELINVNIGAVTLLTRLLLPGMVQRGRGAVVNVSSGSELQPLALMAVYASTKAYVRNFTLAIREEYSSKGIHVQHVAPLFVSTKINAFSQRLLDGNLLVPDAATYARHAVAALGRVHNTSGYWLHGIQTFFIKLAPEWIRIKIGANLNQQFRQEYLENQKLKAN